MRKTKLSRAFKHQRRIEAFKLLKRRKFGECRENEMNGCRKRGEKSVRRWSLSRSKKIQK